MTEELDSPLLIDIIPPAVPPVAQDGHAWVLGLAVAALLLLGLWAFWRWFRSERQQSLRGLKRLRKAYRTQQITPREVSYWLAAFLRRCLHTNHLSAEYAVPAALTKERSRWKGFLRRLHAARYAPREVCDRDTLELLAEAGYWLRRWR